MSSTTAVEVIYMENDPSTTAQNPLDPLSLIQRKKSPEQIPKKKKQLQKFYEIQNKLIDQLVAPLNKNTNSDGDSSQSEKRDLLKTRIGIYGSLCANILLAALQLIAVLRSGSLSVLATMADAFMDLLSGAILLAANHFSKTKKGEEHRYPVGKSRFEIVGVIIFGTLMSTVSLQIILSSVQSIVGKPEVPQIEVITLALVGTAIGIKLCLYLYCRMIKVSSVQVLAQDHRNDILLNSVGITMGILSAKLNLPILDPLGAILVALVMFRTWSVTVISQGRLIAGKAADTNLLKKITYLAMTHDERIVNLESCRAYHIGEKVIVEVDIVLPPETTLHNAHDLGESLQEKLESLEMVERAFVHCDYNSTHKPEHRKMD